MVNLHRVYLSLLLSMEEPIRGLTSDTKLSDRFSKLMDKVRSKVGSADSLKQLQAVKIAANFVESFSFEVLNEAQSRKCPSCYLHSLLNLKAVTPEFADEVYAQDYYRFILAYKLIDALRIYYYWLDLEDDYNETKIIMLVAYIVGIVISAGITVFMFDRFFKKKTDEEKDEDDEDEGDKKKGEEGPDEIVDQRL